MNCRNFEDARLLAAYGEPAGAEFESHRAFCDECRGEIEKIRSVRRAYAATQDEAMPASLKARIMGPRRVRWTLAAAAAAGIVIVIGLQSSPPAVVEPPKEEAKVKRNITAELDRIDQELGWHELVLGR